MFVSEGFSLSVSEFKRSSRKMSKITVHRPLWKQAESRNRRNTHEMQEM